MSRPALEFWLKMYAQCLVRDAGKAGQTTVPPPPAPTAAERREQVISFAYGNTHLHNPEVTRPMVVEAYDRLQVPDGVEVEPSLAVGDRLTEELLEELLWLRRATSPGLLDECKGSVDADNTD